MTISLQNVAIEQFRDVFDNEYQQMMPELVPTVMNIRGIVGKAYHSKVAGEILMHDRGAFQSDIPPTDVNYTDVILTFENKTAAVPSDIFEQAEVNASERMNLARSSAWSIARQENQIIINALDASTTSPLVPDNGTNLTVEKLREAKATLDRNNVPKSGRHWLGHANNLQGLLGETETTNANYNTVRALVEGEIDTFMGFKFHFLGDMAEGGVPLSGSTRTNFAYHESSAMMVYGQLDRVSNPGVEIEWDTRARSWVVYPSLRAGSKVILPEGVVRVNCLES